MKIRIVRFSPHQNAKALSILVAVVSAIFMVPFGIIFSFFPPSRPPSIPGFSSGIVFLLFPFIYLIFGYLATLIFCALYNFIARFTGGIEFVTAEASIE